MQRLEVSGAVRPL